MKLRHIILSAILFGASASGGTLQLLPGETITVSCVMPSPSPSPSPSPIVSISPSPSPVASPSPIPSPSPSSSSTVVGTQSLDMPNSFTLMSWANSISVSSARGEVIGRNLFFKTCVNPAATGLPSGVTVQFYQMQKITTTKPSYVGSTLGDYYDILVPYSSACLSGNVFADIAVANGVAPGNYSFKINDLSVNLKVNSLTMPAVPSVPITMGLQLPYILKTHGLDPFSNVSVFGPLYMKYIQLMRANRIEPFSQNFQSPAIASGTLSLDDFSAYQASFRQTNITGAIGPNCLIPHIPGIQNQTFYQAAQASMTSTPFKAWHYVWDEPQTAADLTTVQSIAQASKQYAPSLETMVTHEPTTALLPYIDHFTTVFEYFKVTGHWTDYTQAPNYWLYGGCMSHGSCDNTLTGKLTGAPDLMIDTPSIHSRMYPVVAAALGAKAALYYTVNQVYGQMDPWVNQFNFSGNGDGQLVYPANSTHGFTTNDALPSYRMKMIRQGMYDVEYLKQAGFSKVVTDQFNWTKDHAVIEAIRAGVN